MFANDLGFIAIVSGDGELLKGFTVAIGGVTQQEALASLLQRILCWYKYFCPLSLAIILNASFNSRHVI